MSSVVEYAFVFSEMALFSLLYEPALLITVKLKNCHHFYIVDTDWIGGSGRREGGAEVLEAENSKEVEWWVQ